MDVNRKGCLSFDALMRLCTNHQPLALATGFHPSPFTLHTSTGLRPKILAGIR